MGVSARVETVSTVEFVCDKCGKKDVVAEVVADASAVRALGGQQPLPTGWREVIIDSAKLIFHTQRCAIGYFRAKVAEAWKIAK